MLSKRCASHPPHHHIITPACTAQGLSKAAPPGPLPPLGRSHQFVGNAVSTFTALIIMERRHASKFAAHYNGGDIPLQYFVPLLQVRTVLAVQVKPNAVVLRLGPQLKLFVLVVGCRTPLCPVSSTCYACQAS